MTRRWTSPDYFLDILNGLRIDVVVVVGIAAYRCCCAHQRRLAHPCVFWNALARPRGD